MQPLNQKVAVITGSSRGLGLSIASVFAREGAAVIISSRSGAACEKAAAELRAQGYRAAAFACDVANAEQVEALAQFAEQTFGRIDIWVNNAAISTAYGPTLAQNPASYTAVTQANILGTYYGSISALKRFTAQGSGKLINMLGRGSDRPAPFQTAYGSSKVWVLWFTRALAEENKGRGVEVMALNPGLMLTDLLTQVNVIAGYEDRMTPFFTVVRMWALPPEVAAEKALWMASAATDGRNGLQASILTPGLLIQGLLREGWRRLTGRPAPENPIKIIPVQPD